MGTLRAFINTDHFEFERWGRPLVDADWHAFCHTIYKGIEGEEWKSCIVTTDMSKATGDKKPSESQNAKALWAMKAAKDWGGEYCDPARKGHSGENKDTAGVAGRTPQRPFL